MLGIDEKTLRSGFRTTPHCPGRAHDREGREEENFRRVERRYGSFTRSFTLPSSVEPGQVSARCDKGVLKINLAKKAEAKATQIKVNVGGEKTLEAQAPGRAA